MSNSSEILPTTINDLRERLMQHLTIDGEVKKQSESFSALKSFDSKVDFALKLLEQYEIALPFVPAGKNDKKALEYRLEGNAAFKMKNAEKALEFYTKSVAFSAENGENLAIAYANRSAVLFELNETADCLSDIERALPNYPEQLRAKLVKRQNSIGKVQKPSYHEPIPLIIEDNEVISCATDCIRIETNDTQGRHVTAARDVQVGEILAIEEPFTLITHRFDHCHECLELSHALIPCPHCTGALYCSAQCRLAARKHHEHLCPLGETIQAADIDELKQLALKVAVLSTVQPADEIDALCTNAELRSVADLFERAVYSALLYRLVERHGGLFAGAAARRAVFKERILRHLQTGPSNYHEITELVRKSGVLVPEGVASGAFSFHSMLNHSCCPNVGRFCYGRTIVLRAIERIRSGEQCFDNYGYHYALVAKKERKDGLKAQYHFECECKACESNWAMYDALVEIEKAPKVEHKLIEQLSSDRSSIRLALEVLEDLIDDLNSLEDGGFKPSKNYSQVQECVKHCFALFGTKRPVL